MNVDNTIKPRALGTAGPRGELVVLVHGLWMHGVFMKLLGLYLEQQGFRTLTVSYDSMTRTPAQNADAVWDDIRLLDEPVIHLVGHSLGGIVILHLLHRHPQLAPGKTVLIGSPVHGSSLARRICDTPLGVIFGRSVEEGLLGGAPPYRSDRPLGVVVGTRHVGIAALLHRPDRTSDGAVLAEEAHLPESVDEVQVPYAHSTMVFSRRCAGQVAAFLADGRFERRRPGSRPDAQPGRLRSGQRVR